MRCALTFLSLILIAIPARAEIETVLPEKAECHMALASGDVARVLVDFGHSPQIKAIESDDWSVATNEVQFELVDVFEERVWVFSASDSADVVSFVFVYQGAAFDKSFSVELFHDGGGRYDRLAFGNGICSPLEVFDEKQSVGEEGLFALLDPRSPDRLGECVAVNSSGAIVSWFARPAEDYKITLEPLLNAPFTEQISVTRVEDSPPLLPEFALFRERNFPAQILSNWIISDDLNTRGSFNLSGRDGTTEWMLMIDLWIIEGVDTPDKRFAAHCGGVGA